MDVIRKQIGNPGCDWKCKDSNKQIYLGASQNEHESDRMDGYSKEWLLTSAVQFLNPGSHQPIWTCALESIMVNNITHLTIFTYKNSPTQGG